MTWIRIVALLFQSFMAVCAGGVILMIAPTISPWMVFLILILGSITSGSRQFMVDFLTAATGNTKETGSDKAMTYTANLPKDDAHALIEWIGQALYNHDATLAVESGEVDGNFHAPTVLTLRFTDANGHILEWLRKRKASQQASRTAGAAGETQK